MHVSLRNLVAAFGAGWLGLASAAAAAAAPTCRISLIGELKLEPGAGSPHLKGEVEGRPVTIVADTGAFSTLLLETTARRLHIPLDDARGVTSYGAGGMARTYITPLVNVKLSGVSARIPLLVTSGRVGVDMLLGDDFFNQADVELDLKHDAIRLLRFSGCTDDQMPYWSKGGYSLARLLPTDGAIGQYVTKVRLNGRPVRAVIDSGADTTVVTAEAAQAVGLKPGSARGHALGLGDRVMDVHASTAAELAVGDEVIHAPTLDVADLNGGVSMGLAGSRLSGAPADLYGMLLGDDFLRSHRVILSHSRGKAYFTYEGGPVFESAAAQPARAKGSPASPPGTPPPAEPSARPAAPPPSKPAAA